MEAEIIQMHILENMPIILDVFHYLQARSKHYPLVNMQTIKDYMLMYLKGVSLDKHRIDALESIIRETAIQNESSGIDQMGVKKLNRSMIVEVMFRWAIYIYADKNVMKGARMARI